VFLIVPHIVREPHFDSKVEREIDTGTENAIRLRENSIGHAAPDPDRQVKH
jgi:hypothetical protein